MLHSDTICVTVISDDIALWVSLWTVLLRGSESMCNITLGEVTHTKKMVQIGKSSSLDSPTKWLRLFSPRTEPRCSGWTSLEKYMTWTTCVFSESFECFATYIEIHSRILEWGVLSDWSVGVEIIDMRYVFFLKGFCRNGLTSTSHCLMLLPFQRRVFSATNTQPLSFTCTTAHTHTNTRTRCLAELRSIAPQLSPWVKLAYRSRCSPCEESDLHIMQHQSSVKTANVC